MYATSPSAATGRPNSANTLHPGITTQPTIHTRSQNKHDKRRPPLPNEFAAFFVLNIQSMNPSADSECRWKITHLQEIIVNQLEFIPFISITESGLKSYIMDAQVHISIYNVYCAGRHCRNNGGALLYIHQDLPATHTTTFDDQICSAVICTVNSMNYIIVSVYRPLSASFNSFKAMKFIQDYINLKPTEKCYDIIITGDFTFLTLTGAPFLSMLFSARTLTSQPKNFLPL